MIQIGFWAIYVLIKTFEMETGRDFFFCIWRNLK